MKHKKHKLLFLLRKNHESGGQVMKVKSGLFNSCRLLISALKNNYLIAQDSELVVCNDANDIDREISTQRPDVAVIEALWVTPEKLKEIQRLHKKVVFVVRLHSNIPFLSQEGIAIEWLREYNKIARTVIGFNNEVTTVYMDRIVNHPTYLPNIYQEENFNPLGDERHFIAIGCFGAIRPLKNQLVQAIAALRFADNESRIIHYHINALRVEQNGEPALKNIRALFADTHHKLIEHSWLSHSDFFDLIASMDVGLQVSLSESFNIITADFVHSGVPIIVSSEISWMHNRAKVDNPGDADEIAAKIKDALEHRNLFIRRGRKALEEYNGEALEAWQRFLTD